MFNLLPLIKELQDMNDGMVDRLDKIINQLELLVELFDAHNKIDSGEFDSDPPPVPLVVDPNMITEYTTGI